MKLDFISNSKTNDHKISVSVEEDKDINEAREIIKMMEEKNCPSCGHKLNNGWEILIKNWMVARECIIEKIKRVSATESDARLSQIRASVLKGFDECFAMPSRIVAEVEEYLKNKKEEKPYEDEA